MSAAPLEQILRRMRTADKDPRVVWQRVLDKARRGEVNLYCEKLAREALQQLTPREREPEEEGQQHEP